MDISFLKGNKIIPVVVLNDIEDTLPTLRALSEGGITAAEITFRTACARDAIALAKAELPGMVIGAGTVINAAQCEAALEAGAEFIVSPGFSAEVLRCCREACVPCIPGAVTPTEIMNLLANGIDLVKFFPAEASGGIKTLKALASAFPGAKFMPTGGINADNITDYLRLPFVAAAGGSWMMKSDPEETAVLSAQAIRKVNEL